MKELFKAADKLKEAIECYETSVLIPKSREIEKSDAEAKTVIRRFKCSFAATRYRFSFYSYLSCIPNVDFSFEGWYSHITHFATTNKNRTWIIQIIRIPVLKVFRWHK